jgi:hypothetical protein
MVSGGDRETIERIDADLLNLNAYNERLFNAIDSLRSSHSTDAFLGYTAVVEQVRDRLRRLESHLDALALQRRTALRGRVHELIWFTLASFGVALFLGLVMSVAIARNR